MSLLALAVCVSALLCAPIAVFAPLGMAPLAAGSIVLALLDLVRDRRARWRTLRHPAMVIAAVLAAWMLLSAIWAIDRTHAVSVAVRCTVLIGGATLLCLMAARLDSKAAMASRRAMMAGFALLTLFAAFELVTHGAIVRAVVAEKYATVAWRDVAVSRGTVVMALMVWPVMAACRRQGLRHGSLVALAAAMVVAVLTEHNATRAALALGFVAWVSVYAFGRPVVLVIGGGITAFVLTAPLWPMGPLSLTVWQPLIPKLEMSLAHRLYIWDFVAGKIAQRPLSGWGVGSSRFIPGSGETTPVGGSLLSLHPHNGALQVWLELGMVGAVLAAALLAVLVRGLVRLYDAGPDQRFAAAAATAALTAAFVVANLSFGVWQNWWLGSLGLVAAWTTAATAAASPRREPWPRPRTGLEAEGDRS